PRRCRDRRVDPLRSLTGETRGGRLDFLPQGTIFARKPAPVRRAHQRRLTMAFELPNLPYAYDALAPFMSAETLEFHHDKHHQAYVTNGNKLLEGSGLEGKSLEEVVTGSFGKNAGLFNNAGQHYNHIHFWKWMKPGGGGKT